MAKSTLIAPPNYGLYPGIPTFTVPGQGLADGLNFRVHEKALTSFNMGWEKFNAQSLGGPVTMLDTLHFTDGTQLLVAGTLTDLFDWTDGTSTWAYITQRYEVGTAAAAGTAVTGTGTAWSTASPPVRAGDQISFGATGRRALTDTWFTVSTVNTDTSITLTATAGTVVDGPYTIRLRFQSANLNNFWRTASFPRGDIGAVIADRWYATNNAIDNIVRFTQSATQVTRVHLGAGGFKCKTLARWKDTLLYLNIVENSGTTPNKPMSFKNSDVGLPETVTGGVAGEFVAVQGGSSPIQTAAPIGDDLVVYTTNEVVNVTFVGTPDIWAFRNTVSGTGLVAPRLLAPGSSTHQFVGRDGLYNYNGITAETTDMHIWHHLSHTHALHRIDYGFSIYDEENGQLIWCLALAGDPADPPAFAYEQAYLEEMPQGVNTPYSVREFPFTAAGFFERGTELLWSQMTEAWSAYNFAWSDQFFAGKFPLVLVGDNSGQVYKLNTINTKDGAAMASFVQFGKRLIGDMRHRNLLTRVYPLVQRLSSATYNLIVTTQVFDHQDSAAHGTDVSNFALTLSGDPWVTPYRAGRWAQVQFGTLGSTTGEPWRLHGYDWDVREGGMA